MPLKIPVSRISLLFLLHVEKNRMLFLLKLQKGTIVSCWRIDCPRQNLSTGVGYIYECYYWTKVWCRLMFLLILNEFYQRSDGRKKRRLWSLFAEDTVWLRWFLVEIKKLEDGLLVVDEHRSWRKIWWKFGGIGLLDIQKTWSGSVKPSKVINMKFIWRIGKKENTMTDWE